MLILDKQKAVEHIVALAALSQPAGAAEDVALPGARRRRRVATFERTVSGVAEARAARPAAAGGRAPRARRIGPAPAT
ncbi:MAG TPA: hypothetical protein VFC53_05365 [Dehalococcoidia bacterium]|nr:hypothetical protein [Dehalococcoidia bacterium]